MTHLSIRYITAASMISYVCDGIRRRHESPSPRLRGEGGRQADEGQFVSSAGSGYEPAVAFSIAGSRPFLTLFSSNGPTRL